MRFLNYFFDSCVYIFIHKLIFMFYYGIYRKFCLCHSAAKAFFSIVDFLRTHSIRYVIKVKNKEFSYFTYVPFSCIRLIILEKQSKKLIQKFKNTNRDTKKIQFKEKVKPVL